MEIFFRTSTHWDYNHHFACDCVEYVVKGMIEKFTYFLKHRGYLSPFQWILLANIINRWNSVSDFEVGVVAARRIFWCAHSIKFMVPSIAFKSLFLSKEGLPFNGIYRTNDDLMIDLALKRYFENENAKVSKNSYSVFDLWYRLTMNREIRRRLDRKYEESMNSLYLYIFEKIVPLLIRVRAISELAKEDRKYGTTIQQSGCIQNLNTISQIMKEIVPSWETGPPVPPFPKWKI